MVMADVELDKENIQLTPRAAHKTPLGTRVYGGAGTPGRGLQPHQAQTPQPKRCKR